MAALSLYCFGEPIYTIAVLEGADRPGEPSG